MIDSGRILILFGSQTFTAQEAAERIWRTTKIMGLKGPVQAMDDYPISSLINEEFALFVCATTGQGDEPDNMQKFWKFLLRKNLPSNSLKRLKFGVLAFGDSSYTKFNFVGKKLHKRLLQLGATPLVNVGLCDYQHDLGNDAVMQPWLKEYFSCLKKYYPDIQTDNLNASFIPRWKVSLQRDVVNSVDKFEDIYFGQNVVDRTSETKLFTVESNVRTTSEDHFQDVRLMSLKTSDDTELSYEPGDIFNIRPRNSQEDIDDLFGIFETHNLDIKPHHIVVVEKLNEDMPVPPHFARPLPLHAVAAQYWDLRCYPTQYVFSLLALVSDDKLERDKCIELSTAEGQEDWLNYCRRPKRTVLEVLHDFHKSASKLTIEVMFEMFSTVKPRSFSIASSCLTDSKRLDLLVAVVKYYSKLKKPRLGLASNWLKDLNVGDKVYGWVKKGTMKFPSDKTTPTILIGPGTGLAPFRSYLHTRRATKTASAEHMHLFFGCRYREKDFHCREELEEMEGRGEITLYCAFSRDQEDKVYVQHKISEHAQTLWPLINDKKAYIYISGNSKNMPDNVKDAIAEDVISKCGNLPLDGAKSMLKEMEGNGRLQIETW